MATRMRRLPASQALGGFASPSFSARRSPVPAAWGSREGPVPVITVEGESWSSLGVMGRTSHKAFSERQLHSTPCSVDGRPQRDRPADAHLGPWTRPELALLGTVPAGPPGGAAPASAPAGSWPTSRGRRLWQPPPQPLPLRSKGKSVVLPLTTVVAPRDGRNPEFTHAKIMSCLIPHRPSTDLPTRCC